LTVWIDANGCEEEINADESCVEEARVYCPKKGFKENVCEKEDFTEEGYEKEGCEKADF
jgi:hypothetical protein